MFLLVIQQGISTESPLNSAKVFKDMESTENPRLRKLVVQNYDGRLAVVKQDGNLVSNKGSC